MAAGERKFLIFYMQGKHYALDLAHVAEVADPPRMWPIPRAPACYNGAVNIHGAIVAVMDLAVFLGLSNRMQHEKIIILNRDVAALAFLVDRVIRIVPEQEVVICDDPPGRCNASSTMILPEGEATLLDVDAIVQAAENMMK